MGFRQLLRNGTDYTAVYIPQYNQSRSGTSLNKLFVLAALWKPGALSPLATPSNKTSTVAPAFSQKQPLQAFSDIGAPTGVCLGLYPLTNFWRFSWKPAPCEKSPSVAHLQAGSSTFGVMCPPTDSHWL